MVRGFLLVLMVGVVAGMLSCGGGGGGGIPGASFQLAGTSPDAGEIGASTGGALAFTFTSPINIGSLSASTIRLETIDGRVVKGTIDVQPFNAANVRFQSNETLRFNTIYRVTLDGTITSEGGRRLGEDVTYTFITGNPTPTVRPDQLLDLGDGLQVPRFHARAVKTRDGRVYIFGGYTNPETVTNTIEVFDPKTRSFSLLDTRMKKRRADHTVTLMNSGLIVIVGGVARPDGPPLRTTEFFDPSDETIADGPDMNFARTWHAASPHFDGASVFVSGGFDAAGDRMRSAEYLNVSWTLVASELPVPTAEHVQYGFAFDRQYIGVGGFDATGALFNGLDLEARQEIVGGARFRGQALTSGDGSKLIVFGGDTPSVILYDFAAGFTSSGSQNINPRRGDHSVTRWGAANQFLIAGGQDVANGGGPLALHSMVVARYNGDVELHNVVNVLLPVHFSGHIGIELNDGVTLLAGGVGDRVNDHSRRVVLVTID